MMIGQLLVYSQCADATERWHAPERSIHTNSIGHQLQREINEFMRTLSIHFLHRREPEIRCEWDLETVELWIRRRREKIKI